MSPKDKKHRKVLKSTIAGAIAGGLDVLFTYPTYYINKQLKLDRYERKYDGTIDCIRKTIKRHGFSGLYRGMSILLIGSIVQVATRFGAYEFFTHKFREKDGTTTVLNSLLSGLLAGVTEAVVAVTPLETLKLKITNDMHRARPRYNGLLHGLRVILKREGIRGIYRGGSITVLKQSTTQAISFFLMVTQKDLYAGSDSTVIVPMPVVGIFGVISGAATVLGGTPLELLRKEGPKAFFKGSIIRMAHICVDVALTFMIYESLMEYVFTHLWV